MWGNYMRGENEIGLVLSGGGAKGAFQVGVLQAMKEEGLLPYVTAVSGTSAGALNAALLLNVDADEMEKVWKEFTFWDFIGVSTLKKESKNSWLNLNMKKNMLNPDLDFFKKQSQVNPIKMLYAPENVEIITEKKGTSKLRNFLISTANSLFGGLASQKEISKLIYKYIDIKKTFTNSIDCYITCYQDYKKVKRDNSENATEVFLINNDYKDNLRNNNGDIFHNDKIWTPCHIHNILLASIALPIYAPVNINGKLYSDGGLESKFSPELSKAGKGNVPYNVLLENDTFKNLIIVNLEKESIPPQTNKNIIEIKLHKTYFSEFEKLIELANFTEKNISQLIALGKEEAKNAFIQFQETIAKIKSNPPPTKQYKRLRWDILPPSDCNDLKYLASKIKENKPEILFKSKSKVIMNALEWIFSYNNDTLPPIISVLPSSPIYKLFLHSSSIGLASFSALCGTTTMLISGLAPISIPIMFVLCFLYKIFGKQLMDKIQKYTCYQIPNSDYIRLYLNEI